jgi:hypothetical protein
MQRIPPPHHYLFTCGFTLHTVVPVVYRIGHKRAHEHCTRNVANAQLWVDTSSTLVDCCLGVEACGEAYTAAGTHGSGRWRRG